MQYSGQATIYKDIITIRLYARTPLPSQSNPGHMLVKGEPLRLIIRHHQTLLYAPCGASCGHIGILFLLLSYIKIKLKMNWTQS